MTEISSGDTAWLLVSTALVMLMIPGLALFYGGMVQGKNVLSTLMHSMGTLAIVTLTWSVLGYTLAFGDTVHGLVGNLKHLGMAGVGQGAKGTIPHLLFFFFQATFAA